MADADYAQGQWDLAIQGFEAYVRSFPRSDMADDAQVRIGNSYLQDRKYEKAVEAYDAAIRNYPNGNAVPEAYYKKGIALQSLGQRDRAREALEYAIKTYPDSEAGRLGGRQQGTAADDGRHPHASGAVAAASDPARGAQRIPEGDQRADRRADRRADQLHAQGVRRPEAEHRQRDERPPCGPRESRRQ